MIEIELPYLCQHSIHFCKACFKKFRDSKMVGGTYGIFFCGICPHCKKYIPPTFMKNDWGEKISFEQARELYWQHGIYKIREDKSCPFCKESLYEADEIKKLLDETKGCFRNWLIVIELNELMTVGDLVEKIASLKIHDRIIKIKPIEPKKKKQNTNGVKKEKV